MSKFTKTQVSGSTGLASGAGSVLFGPYSTMEYNQCTFIVENCATVAIELQIQAVGGDLAVNIQNAGFCLNTASVVAAQSLQAYHVNGVGFEKVRIRACATATIGASQFRIYFSGRRSD